MATRFHLPLPQSGSVRFSPDGSLCAVTHPRGTRVLDVRTGRVVSELWEGWSAAELAFSPDGRALAGRLDVWGVLSIARWDGDTFVEAEEWEAEDDSWGLHFSPCGEYLVAGTKHGFEVFAAKTGDVEFAYAPKGERVVALDCTPQRDVWLTAQHARRRNAGSVERATLRRWMWPFDEATSETHPYRVPDISRAAFNPDGDLVGVLFGYSSKENETLQVYSLSRRMILHAQPGITEPANILRWSHCGRYLALSTQTGIAVGVFDFHARALAAEYVVGRRDGDGVGEWADDADFSPDGTLLAIGATYGGLVKLSSTSRRIERVKSRR